MRRRPARPRAHPADFPRRASVAKGSTITALATPRGAAALAMIRVSGPDAFSIVKACLDARERFDRLGARRLALVRFTGPVAGEVVDEVSIVKYAAPGSYTGEDTVEITCHGGLAVVERILEELMDAGAVYAVPGEFTKRAFLNGKMDLARAESVHQVVQSRTTAQHRRAVWNYFGGYRRKLEAWRAGVEEIVSLLETGIEFEEEHEVGDVSERARENACRLLSDVEKELEGRESMRERERGVQVAFVGPPNAGKSTLLNLVLGYERSIVFGDEGTTRDAVSEWVTWHGHDVKFIDSAGLRSTDQEVERLGVERTWAYIEKCDLVVLVTAADES
ncbi:MAG: GTP-binding protein, partial [Chitinivibrionales bacterium]|nr:GTP-binding protein [Chitinivibrionales bacterium]